MARSRLVLFAAVGLVAVGAVVVLHDRHAPPAPVPPPAAPVPAVVTAKPLPAAPEPAAELVPPPVAEPVAITPAVPLQSILLRDGRRFVGIHEPAEGSIVVAAAIRGGDVKRMQAIRVRVAASDIVSSEPYDGRHGDLAMAYVPPPADPRREAELVQAHAVAAERAEARRQEAAERERLRAQEQRHAEAVRRAADARTAIALARERIIVLAAHVPTLHDDRRLKLELINGLQLQINAARDRWNLEVQNLGPRVVAPDGTRSGGPTPATETLVAQLAQQIRAAREEVTRLEATLRAEANERLALEQSLPRLDTDVQEADAALANLSP